MKLQHSLYPALIMVCVLVYSWIFSLFQGVHVCIHAFLYSIYTIYIASIQRHWCVQVDAPSPLQYPCSTFSRPLQFNGQCLPSAMEIPFCFSISPLSLSRTSLNSAIEHPRPTFYLLSYLHIPSPCLSILQLIFVPVPI